MDIDQNEFIVGGYFLTQPLQRENWMAVDLLPEHFISLSGCISNILQVPTSWQQDIPDEARNLGMQAESWKPFDEWCKACIGVNIGNPDTFLSLDAARQVAHDFFPTTEKMMLIGIGLHQDRVDSFLERHADPGEHYGVYQVLQQRQSMPTNGEVLGFEVLAYDMGLTHSWICFNMPAPVHETYQIELNFAGLIETQEESLQARELVNNEEGGQGWQPWLVVEYPIQLESP